MTCADTVWVVAHSCVDGSNAGLATLQEIWGPRLRVLLLDDDDHFWQEAVNTVLLHLSQDDHPDWIYVFDADEFMLTRDPAHLREILASVDPGCSAVRYQVQNWVSFENFDDTDLDQYARLQSRSQPSVFSALDWATMADEIWSGNLNFFDLPFPSKIIHRNDR
jgi:hypothetical protein